MQKLTLLAGIAACVPLGAQGQLSLKELVEEARAHNQEILAAQKTYEGARQRPSHAGSLPDPVFSPGYNRHGNPLPEPAWDAGHQHDRLHGDAGFRTRQAAVARRRCRQGARRLVPGYRGGAQRHCAVEASLRGVVYSYAVQQLLSKPATSFVNSAGDRSAIFVGRAAQQDIFKAQAQLCSSRPLLQSTRAAREAEVNSLLDRAPGSALGIPEEPRTERFACRSKTGRGRARSGASRMREQKRKSAKKQPCAWLAEATIPTTLLPAAIPTRAECPRFIRFADLKIPLYYTVSARRGHQQAQAVARAQHSYQAAGQSLRARITEQYAAAETSLELMRIYTQDVIPQANLALESSLISYQTGAVDFLSVLNNQLAVLEYQMNVHEEMQNYLTAVSRLEEISGVSWME
jgi:hypothetical protein